MNSKGTITGLSTSFTPKEALFTMRPVIHWANGCFYYYADAHYGGFPPIKKGQLIKGPIAAGNWPAGWHQREHGILMSVDNELAASGFTNEFIAQEDVLNGLREIGDWYITHPAIYELSRMGYSVLVKQIVEEVKTTTTTYQEIYLPLEDRSNPVRTMVLDEEVDEKIETHDSHTALEKK